MEVTPEIYAWFTSLNIINPFLSYDEDPMNNFILPEKTTNLLFGGKYFDIILKHLQDSYNKCFNVKMDFIFKLKELKQISEDEDYISNSIKNSNWSLIFETLKKFGINYVEEDLDKIINGDTEFLSKVLTKIYELNTDYLKKANEKKAKGKKMYLSSNKNQTEFDKNSKFSNNINDENIEEEEIKTEENNNNIEEEQNNDENINNDYEEEENNDIKETKQKEIKNIKKKQKRNIK